MPGITQLIVVMVLVVLVAALATLTWRVARWSARTRSVVEFRTGVAALTGRADAVLGKAAEAVDTVRRGAIPPMEIGADLGEAFTAAERLAAEARALRSPAGAESIRSGLVEDLERAGRALEMVQHGCGLLTTARGREHDAEGQTAIKRGYLNLVHVRESVARQAAAAAAIPVTIPRFLARRPAE
jgi:hypothetical protein